jgi:hypothetical protein
MERRNFDREYVTRELRNLGLRLERKTTVFVAGGAAMALMDLKEATKDIDVVLKTRKEVDSLLSGLHRLGYKDPRRFVMVSPARMGARAIRQNGDGFRWDIFEKVVANSLHFSPGMVERGRDWEVGRGKLVVRLLSKEDIFLLKSVTDREGDLEDMRVIAESSVRWDRIVRECRWQAVHSKRIWENALCERLRDLRRKYGIASPIEKEVCSSAVRKILKLDRKEDLRPRLHPASGWL